MKTKTITIKIDKDDFGQDDCYNLFLWCEMKTEIMQKIIDKQDELIKISDELTTVGSSLSSLRDSAMFGDRFNKLSNEQDYLYEKYREIKSDITSLKSQLAEAEEEKVWDDVEKEWKEMQRPLDEPINL